MEDDRYTTELIKLGLQEQRYIVDTAADGQAGWELAETVTYDLIMLDMMLPKLDGISFCHRLREKGSQVPVVLLTARNTSIDKVKGLDAGADDYVVKPVELQELAARIRALVRRGATVATSVLQWGDLCLNPSSCEVTYSNHPLHLTPKEYALLELFLRNSSRVYSRSAILEQLWALDDEPPGEDTVKSHIKGLRQKLKLSGAADLVETVYGLGYRLNPAYLKEQQQKQTSVVPLEQVHERQQQTQATVAKIWERARISVLKRLGGLEQATRALLANELDENLRHLAEQDAHKLAGSLGTFGIQDGTQIARQIESLFQPDSQIPQAQLSSLPELIAELKQIVTNPAHSALQGMSSPPKSELATTQQSRADRQPLLFIVDEDWELTELLSIEAEQWGLRTITVADPIAAKAEINRTRPDVVLLNLPSSGTSEAEFNLLTELGRQTPPLPVLVSTERNQFIDRVRIAQLKGRGFLQKPMTSTQVLEAVNQVLQQTKTATASILVVDDSPLILKLLCKVLEPWGFRVTTLEHPAQFWDVLEATAPDLLILDVEMPEIGGIELCRTLRNDLRWGWLPVLFLTGQTDIETIHQVFAAGADDYISKPIVAPALVTRIINRLERARILRSQAEVDLLTGTANRQKATQDLERFINLAKRFQQSLCLAVLKIDRLKQTNQQYGHEAGDKALRYVGQHLRQHLRREDVIARWGGAEFVVGMYGMTCSEGADWLAENLETLRLEELNTPNGEAIRVTYSAGVAQYLEDGMSVQALYRSAQEALEQAKAAGGDRVLSVGWESSQRQSRLNSVILAHQESPFAASLLHALETRGYQSHWLKDGKTAIECFSENAFDLQGSVIVLEENLPKQDGVQVLRRLARSKVTQQSRVILLLSDAKRAEKVMELGAFDYIVTPCELPVLMQHLRRALSS